MRYYLDKKDIHPVYQTLLGNDEYLGNDEHHSTLKTLHTHCTSIHHI